MFRILPGCFLGLSLITLDYFAGAADFGSDLFALPSKCYARCNRLSRLLFLTVLFLTAVAGHPTMACR
ncbi:hypothetical protein N825_26020 [Skermanella stibiiresistens SB22]|uniref:Uncharacterized protein n=1 Tax=Skermanella stibiiresistens SB22 TaxID=1385369 RepID=W9GVN1_9PROT|nr:hypothetical protein N825_26020 [Skermanella stibiiresistens SB22]